MGADYLAYALIDAIVDQYFVVLEKFGETIADLEEKMLANPRQETMTAIHRLKREMIMLRKSVWPLREVIGSLQRGESPLIHKHTRAAVTQMDRLGLHVLRFRFPLTLRRFTTRIPPKPTSCASRRCKTSGLSPSSKRFFSCARLRPAPGASCAGTSIRPTQAPTKPSTMAPAPRSP
jgi:hypothetical protein